mmetsp:Transcript_95306/g.308738  ORF Transcript_95306/g.308738 Transcript_95306/m.308738 type:complete len:854 (-) Transcript_95306:198-2759(-)
MVLLGLAVGGAGIGGVANMYKYNRDGWMTDVQVNQARRFQRQQVRLSQAEMFREDIRDLVGASVAKQNNYVLIATLILGMIAECFVEGPMPEGAAEFVTSAYMLCVGSSLLYLVLSVLCAVTATTLASNCQKDLLTTLVRLPVDEFVAEIDEAAPKESVEAFEHQCVTRMFRLPILGRLAGGQPDPYDPTQKAKEAKLAAEAKRTADAAAAQTRFGAAAGAGGRGRPSTTSSSSDLRTAARYPFPTSSGSGAAARLASQRSSSLPPAAAGMTRPEDVRLTDMRHSDARSVSGESSPGEEGSPLGLAENQAKKAERHMDVFIAKEREWDMMARCAFVFGAMGASHLLQAYGYYSAAKYYTGSYWASWVVQFLVVLVDAIFARAYMASFPMLGAVGAVLNILAPLACTLAIRFQQPTWVDAVCIPLCFFCHLVWNCFGCWQLFCISQSYTSDLEEDEGTTKEQNFTDATYPAEPRRQQRAGSKALAQHTKPKATKETKETSEATSSSTRSTLAERRKRFYLLYMGNGIVIMAWCATIIWALVHAFSGDGDNGMVIAIPRKLHSESSWFAEEGAEPKRQFAETDLVAYTALPAIAAELVVVWPSPRFRPHSVACGASNTCFVANDFLVFSLDVSASGAASARPVECNVTGTILDLAVDCTAASAAAGACRPLVLVRSHGAVSVVECAGDSGDPLLSEGGNDIRRIATNFKGELFTLEADRVIQHTGLEPPARGWKPLWPTAEGVAEDVVALDALESGNLLLFRPAGLVDVVDANSGETCGTWAWPTEPRETITSAASIEDGSAVLALHRVAGKGGAAKATRLVRVELPGMARACAAGAAVLPAAASPARLRGRRTV